MEMNFILMEMTHLRYWMPLVIEGSKRGLQSTFFVGASGKYNCPMRCTGLLENLAKEFDINMRPLSQISSASGIIFSNEKTGVNYLDSLPDCKKVVCTYQTDFIESYKTYKEKADHILMPSEFCADFYDRKSDKNLYLGIPKYDIQIDAESVYKKYNIKSDKNALIVWPKNRDEHANRVNMELVLQALKIQGFTNLVKTRGKDPLQQSSKRLLQDNGDHYFEDTSWYPDTTQELLQISDIVINFGSTTIEECIMQNVPLINFDVKPAVRNGSKRPYRVTHEYLYGYNYCIQMKKDFSEAELSAAVNYLTSTDLTEEFKKARQKHLFDHKGSCKRILDKLL